MLKSLYSILIFLVIVLNTNALLAKPIPVRNVKVDVQAKTALEARDIAMNKARQLAFAKLAIEHPEFRISVNEGVPPNKILEGLVIDYEVVREKMSAVRYIGVFNFNFNDRALHSYLSGSHKLVKSRSDLFKETNDGRASFADSQYLIIPIYISPDTSYLWEENNPWGHYWVTQETKTKGKMSGRQFTVPLGDLRDITGVTIEDVLTSKVQPLSLIMERYQGNVALIVILKSLDDGVNSHELQVKAFTRSGLLQQAYEPIVLQGQQGVTLSDIFKNAVQKSFALVTGKGNLDVAAAIEPNYGEDGARTNREDDITSPSNVRVVVSFNNFQDWQAIRQALNRSDYVDDFDVINLNRKQAEIYIKSRVPASTLKEKLAQMGLRLDQFGRKSRLGLSDKSTNYREPMQHKVASPFDPERSENDVETIEDEQESESVEPEVIE